MFIMCRKGFDSHGPIIKSGMTVFCVIEIAAIAAHFLRVKISRLVRIGSSSSSAAAAVVAVAAPRWRFVPHENQKSLERMATRV